MKSWLVFVALVACACPSKQAAAPAAGSGSAPGSAAPIQATTCEGMRAKVEGLYRGEAQQKEPKRVDEAVADNTTMVMADCAKDPAKFVPCLAKAATITEIEKDCIVPIDDEGTEGEPRH